MKSKKSILDSGPVVFPTVYLVYSQLKLYHLSWLIKKNKIFDPVKGPDFEVKLNKDQDVSIHTLFMFTDKEKGIEIKIISNKGTNGYIYTQKPYSDFILIISGDIDWDFNNLFFQPMKKLPEITAILQLKNVNSLIGKISTTV